MKKMILAILIVLSMLFYGCSGGDPSSTVQSDTVQYVQKNYKDFSKSDFESGTKVEDKGNDIYEVDGKMPDSGGWEHSISAKVQLSPNKSAYIVCELWIDGKEYASNSPRSVPDSSQDNNSESVSFDFFQQDLNPEPKIAHYEAIIANKGTSPIDGVKFKIKCDSKDISILVDEPGKIETKDHLEYTCTLNSEINPNESANEYITFQSKYYKTYKIDVYPYDSEGNAFYDSKGKQTAYEIDLDFTSQDSSQVGSTNPYDFSSLRGIIMNSSGASSHN